MDYRENRNLFFIFLGVLIKRTQDASVEAARKRVIKLKNIAFYKMYYNVCF